MFRNLFSWNDNERYYDEPAIEEEMGVDTAASQVIRYPRDPRDQHVNPPVNVMPTQKAMPAPAPRPMPPPRVVPAEVPPPVVVQRQQVQPPPVVKAHVPPALEYKTMEFWVPLCCEGCHRRIEKKLRYVRGIDSVNCDHLGKKVTVRGYAHPAEVLRVLQKMWKRADYWSSVVIVQKPVVVKPPGKPPVQAVEQAAVKVSHGPPGPGHGGGGPVRGPSPHGPR